MALDSSEFRIFTLPREFAKVADSGLEEGEFFIGNRIIPLYAGMNHEDLWWNEVGECEISDAAIAVCALNLSRRMNELEAQ